MVSFAKLTVASLATLAVAAPAPAPAPEQDAVILKLREAAAVQFGDAEVAKRFIDDAVALEARSAQDWISLFHVFQSFTDAGVTFFISAIDSFKNVSPAQLNSTITKAIIQTRLALNQLINWLQNYNGLAGWAKVFVNLYISTGLNAFITNFGLFIIALSTVISKNKLVNAFADDIKGLIDLIQKAGKLLGDSIPGFRDDASWLVNLNSRLQSLLTS